MFEYILRLLILIPLVGGLAWGSLWLWKRVQLGLPQAAAGERRARLVEVLPMGVGAKLAVVEFAGRELLVSVTRAGTTLVADTRDD